MRIVIVLVGIILISTQAFAVDWQFLTASSKGNVWLIDADSIEYKTDSKNNTKSFKGKLKTHMIRPYNMKNIGFVDNSVFYIDFSCEDSKQTILKTKFYRNGKLVFLEKKPRQVPKKAPGTISNSIIKNLCKPDAIIELKDLNKNISEEYKNIWY